MPPKNPLAGSPEDWLRYAWSDLDLAQVTPSPRILRETLCFHAQQAAEKSLKAVLIANTIEFPRTHNLEVLFNLLPQDLSVPETVWAAVSLTQHAVSSRYPREIEPVEETEYQEAIQLAKTLVSWAENLIRPEKMMTASGLAEGGLLNETLSEDSSPPRE